MPAMLRTLLLALPFALLLAGCPTSSGTLDDDDTTEEGPTWEALPDELAWAFENETDDLGAPGAAVAILHGDTLYAQGFGDKHPDGGDPVAPTTLFRIGSITKMMTSTALLQRVDDGQLLLDDELGDFFPSLALAGATPIGSATLHDLLSHQGGISDFTPIAGGSDDAYLRDYTLGDFENNAWMMAPPGSFWNYANPNFSMAGLVVEEVDGRWYREVVEQDVFAGLGMDRSMFLPEDVLADGDYAVGLSQDWTGQTTDILPVEPDAYDDAWSRPAGFAWSTVLDLVTFGSFLLDGDDDVLSPQRHENLVSSHVDTLSFLDRLHYAYGLMRWEGKLVDGDWYEVSTIEHGGAIPGYAAELITVPEHDLVIATLASVGGAYFDDALAATLEELLGEQPAEMPDPDVDPDDFDDYVGVYLDPYNVGEIRVERVDDGLQVEIPVLDLYDISYTETLYPQSRGNFSVVIDDFPIGMTFVFDDPGEPTRWFRTRYFVGDRTEIARGDGATDRARLDAFLAELARSTLAPEVR